MPQAGTPTIGPLTTAPPTWGMTLAAAGCPQCGVAHLVPPGHAGRCPACFAADLQAQPARLRPEPPELVVPFAVSQAQAATALDAWARTVWLRPDDLSGPALAGRLARVYLPLWLVDAEVAGAWAAQAGYDYEVASTQERYRGGQWVTQHLTETRIRWEPRAGRLERAYHNVAVPALEEHARLMADLGNFAQHAATSMSPSALDGTLVRVPSLEPAAAWPAARARLDERIAADCQAAAGAEHIDQARLDVDYRGLVWTQLLLPAYATAYRDDDGRWRPVLINGQSGHIGGTRCASRRKAGFWAASLGAVAAALLILAVLLGLAGALLPPVMLLAGLLLVLAIAAGLLAPLPLVWAWRYNA